MSAANPPRPADILAAHTETRTPTGSHCTCGEWQTVLIPGGPDIADWSWATHLLDALEVAGFGVVRLPKPTAIWSVKKEWGAGTIAQWDQHWTGGEPRTITAHSLPRMMTPGEARTYGAQLLAAAKAAEAAEAAQ